MANTRHLGYDDFDRLKKIKYPVPSPSASPRLEESFTFDKLGNIKTKVDTAGRTTSYDYDAVSRLTKITDALSNETQFTYNARSQMTKVKDELNQEYDFTYDALGRVLTQTRNSQTMTFTYDAVGNRITREDYNGDDTTYTYDVLNRLTAIAYTGASGENASYTYDDLSRLLTATNAAGTVTFTYNNRGRLATEEDVFGHDLEYTYDAAGRRTGLELNNTAHTAYEYDNANRLTTLTDESSNDFTFAYDNANKLLSKTLPNGIVTTYEYDGMSRLKRLKDVYSSTSLFDRQYSYNSANQISQIADLTNTRNFTYDNINRLTGVSVGGSSVESYAYDAAGNRTSSHLSGSYTTGSFNRLTATSTATIGYNNNGSMTSKALSGATWAYTWSRENQLASASDGTSSVSYLYDALGRRVQRTQGGNTSKYSYDGNDVVLDDDNSTLTKYQNGLGIDNKLKQVSGGTSKYFLADHLGSTNGLTNSSGAVLDSTGYDSFGNATNGSFSSRYDFTGRELDPLTGLRYYRARFYDGVTGRFVSEDPIHFGAGDVNLYGYVKNRPVGRKDPSGLIDPSVYQDPTIYKGDLRKIACDLDGYNPWITGEFGGALQFGPLGGSDAIVLAFNPMTFELAGYTKMMSGNGGATGILATAGAQFGVTIGKAEGSRGGGISSEVFIDASAFEGASGSISYDGGPGIGFGVGPTIGGGAAAGLRIGKASHLFSVNPNVCTCRN